ncbi:fimbrial protein [Enterobacter asburiae]|uniref:fimbrial protein n=1 Tax=Enterobacter asburiae TaxID=61645 RepID=UPI0007A66007|nr:fimbrial protein [Enterobacter asburiae]AMX05510.1 ferrous iron transporter B [Enterobacter asburiae]MCB4612747.1 fimbrial protein [Enterobacter asburiae]
MKVKLTAAAIISAFSLAAISAHADDGKINFIGKITDDACTVTNTVSNPLSVTLGTVSSKAFDGSDTAAPTDFKIELTSCPDSAKTAAVKFDGTAANNDSTALQLTQEDGVATGVGIQITDAKNTVVPLHAASSSYDLKTGANSLAFTARYLKVGSAVTSGPANSTTNFTIVYN